eukprot:m51a1_g1018 hypothetical protein (233) ;mRNA; f:636158-637508
MRAHSLDSGAIASACEHAFVRLEGDEHGTDLGPCKRCSTVHPKKLVNIAGAFHEQCDGRERVIVFPRCSTPRRPLAAPRITWVDCAEYSCGPSTAIVAQERPASAVGSAESSGEEEAAGSPVAALLLAADSRCAPLLPPLPAATLSCPLRALELRCCGAGVDGDDEGSSDWELRCPPSSGGSSVEATMPVQLLVSRGHPAVQVVTLHQSLHAATKEPTAYLRWLHGGTAPQQ